LRPFLAIVAVGLGTYALRSVFILALANRRIPPPVIAALDYVAPAVLGALVVSLMIDANGQIDVGPAEMTAFIVGGATVFKTRNFLLAAILGMAAFWGVGAFF
jgi:branched-subunit amino acid transport protein